MAIQLPVKLTAKGLLIPRSIFQMWDEIEVWQEEDRIIIQPKSATMPPRERALAKKALREDGLLLDIEDAPLSPPVSQTERFRTCTETRRRTSSF